MRRALATCLEIRWATSGALTYVVRTALKQFSVVPVLPLLSLIALYS